MKNPNKPNIEKRLERVGFRYVTASCYVNGRGILARSTVGWMYSTPGEKGKREVIAECRTLSELTELIEKGVVK